MQVRLQAGGSSCIRPLLGCKACVGMSIMSYLDNDPINPPAYLNSTTKQTVYTVGTTEPVKTLNKLRYATVFTEGVGHLEGKYRIRLNPNVEPVQHASRRVPIAVLKQLRSTLDQLVQQDILKPVIKPTPWISSLVIVPKENSTLHLCLYPKDLNKAILCHNGAKVSCGFWHVEVDGASSHLTTFHTPLDNTAGKGCHLGSARPQKFSDAGCMN